MKISFLLSDWVMAQVTLRATSMFMRLFYKDTQNRLSSSWCHYRNCTEIFLERQPSTKIESQKEEVFMHAEGFAGHGEWSPKKHG